MANSPALLPVPELVLSDHLTTLGTPMKEWSSSGKIPPVLLITGPSGVGKRTMAYYLAQWILCERSGFRDTARGELGSDDGAGEEFSLFGGSSAPLAEAARAESASACAPCGQCISCLRAITGSWVDFTEIGATSSEASGDEASDEGSSTLKVDQFRKLKESLGFGSHEGGHRIFLIADADRMTTQAANSVLKILEEPPRGWIFLMTASDPTLLLSTVLSRCQSLKLRPFPEDTLRALLSAAGISSERQKLAAALAGGSWGRALSLASDQSIERRQTLFDFLERPQGALGALVDWAAQGDSQFGLLCDQLELLCVDLIRWSVGSDSPGNSSGEHSWVNFDGARALSGHAQRVTRAKGGTEAARAFWIERAERIAQARRQALTPVNRKLLIQDLLIPWLEVSG